MRDLCQDPKDFGSRIDSAEFLSHSRRPRAIAWLLQHFPDSSAQSFRRRLIGREIDADPGPSDANVHVDFVFGQSGSDKGNAKAQSLIDAAIATVRDKYVGFWEYPFER